ncbi:SGNH/GDSL hydrolase family protein [Vagococcus vulneris]|uniref:SGNH hydrolase-type esterase domain-containing protein n=1 Tax=Vagococcus vulneris TaxID=1977869 RepID=A0A429ZZA4_9ENTE|nr:SGNH/GDSL hydrolase family protein [Vagococcus vulneris]RST99310.1 hypothetical protein CBF37_04905 [Vagococcus vulneris]
MRKLKKIILYALFFVFVSLLTFVTLSLVIAPAERINPPTVKVSEKRMEILRISAIGDSLTEGVGDNTKSGGYVPILQRDLTDEQPIDVVQMSNFGKAGDRSDQILKRLKKDKDMQKSVKEANVITMTVGGNDLMQAFQSRIFGKTSIKKFEKPMTKYQKELKKLYEEIRTLNPEAPVYQLGVYNPFLVSFGEIEEAQDIVDFWNNGSREFVNEQKNAFFVPINEEISNGLDGKPTLNEENPANDSSLTKAQAEKAVNNALINNLISEDDSFHPNNLGYQVIANAFEKKISSTKELWFKK